MIYNNQGHPSGEAIVQMDSENAAAMTAQAMHNKYMEMGKKKRLVRTELVFNQYEVLGTSRSSSAALTI